jgi:hypothetical protein
MGQLHATSMTDATAIEYFIKAMLAVNIGARLWRLFFLC